jgi:CheY-like chemotaxis protein/HPt (histidine-containing phosphotransfer) domain-containing protein
VTSILIESGARAGVPDGIRVLVAGANTASLHVLRETLASKRMEMVAADGVESALAVFREASQGRRPFALVILDTRISSGRGLELARSLRGQAPSGPAVIAMTLKAELKEAEEYRAAGVGAYLRQPITQPELRNAITAALASESLERLSAFSSSTHTAVQPFVDVEDRSIMRALAPEMAFDGELFESDPEFLAEIVSLFLKTYPQLLCAIEDAILRNDAPGLSRAAHALKGAVGNFGAKAVVLQAEALETMGKNGNFADAQEGGAALLALMDKFEPELQAALKRAMEQVVR